MCDCNESLGVSRQGFSPCTDSRRRLTKGNKKGTKNEEKETNMAS